MSTQQQVSDIVLAENAEVIVEVEEIVTAESVIPKEADYDEFDQTVIRPNTYILVRLPSNNIRFIKLVPGEVVSLGKFGSFNVNDILGHPFGYTYEIVEVGEEKKLRIVQDEQVDSKLELDADENNQDLRDDPTAQNLTQKDIEALKKAGGAGKDIIDKMVQSHSAFEKKTTFSKEKYLKRKEQKFLRRFTPVSIGTRELVEYYLDKDSRKILDMSVESVGLLMSLANIRPGGKYLVIDDTCGLITSAIMERTGGEGMIVVAHENEHPHLDSLRFMNYSEGLCSRMVKKVNLYQLFYPEEEEFMPELAPEELSAMKSSRRGTYYRRLNRQAELTEISRLFEESGFDALIVASTLNAYTLIPKLIPAVGGSRPVVVYDDSKETLVQTSLLLQKDHRFLAPTIHETRCRPYQSIPGRIHPVMTMRDGGGFIMSGSRVFPTDCNAAIIRNKKRKIEVTETPEAGATPMTSELESMTQTPDESIPQTPEVETKE